MTTKKRIFSFLLTLTMLLSAAAVGGAAFAADIPNITMELSDEDQQLNLLYAKRASLIQPNGDNTWYYTVTDLDHNGRLEFVAASQHPVNRSTNLRVWEVSTDKTALTECRLEKDPEESFPDILTDVSDTYHDAAADVWHYMLYDNVVLSNDEVYTVKTAVSLRDGVIDYDAFAVEHTVVVNGMRSVSHTDSGGISISPEQYNASGNDAMAGAERSSTNFEWLTVDETDNLKRLTDCYAVFTGRKAPTEVFPVPKPAALSAPEEPVPSPVPTPAPTPVYLTVTKNPTNENRTEGETAYFVSSASAYESLTWTFISPDGGQYSSQTMQNTWGGINGQTSTTLSIDNVNTGMNGWGAYCTFYYKGQTARTATAYLYVSAKKGIPAGNYNGTVTDWNYNTITIFVENSVSVTVPWSICTVDGNIDYGVPASLYWDGQNFTSCYIQGSGPMPGPIYGSMSGTAYSDDGGFDVYLSNGNQVFVDQTVCDVIGSFYDGTSCVVYFMNYPSTDNIYSATIYGNEEPMPGPIYGTMDGSAHEGGGGFAIDLSNGSQVYVDGSICNVIGNFYDGAPCTVEFMNYPSSDNIYSATIYGDNGLIVPENLGSYDEAEGFGDSDVSDYPDDPDGLFDPDGSNDPGFDFDAADGDDGSVGDAVS